MAGRHKILTAARSHGVVEQQPSDVDVGQAEREVSAAVRLDQVWARCDNF